MTKFYFSLVAVVVITAYIPNLVVGIDTCVPVVGCPGNSSRNYTEHVANKDNCHTFYKCLGKCGYLMECPEILGTKERLVFNPESKVCDWPENVGDVCSTGSTDTTTASSTDTTTASNTDTTTIIASTTSPDDNVNDCVLKQCDKDSFKLMTHDKDCHKYYVCVHGRVLTSSCKDNLLYNPWTKHCEKDTECLISHYC